VAESRVPGLPPAEHFFEVIEKVLRRAFAEDKNAKR
jgi:hypothetical protein